MKANPVIMNFIFLMGAFISGIGIFVYDKEMMLSRSILLASCIIALAITNHHTSDKEIENDTN